MQEFDSAQTDVIAICVDSVERNLEVASSHGLVFPILSDPELTAIDAFGLRHVGGGMQGDVARPAVFIADETGRITWRSLPENWRVRIRPEDLLAELK